VSGDQCVNLNPRTEPFLNALDTLKVGTAETVGVSDSESDIRSARGRLGDGRRLLGGTMDPDKLMAAKPDFLSDRPVDLLTLPL
jgi:phosphoglycolate phosphatase-like HAD superfamily hydrolase